jgi:nucleotide-binding universal stress UspA family protein
MAIHKIRMPVTGQPEDAVMRRYTLYFANKLQTGLLGIHAGNSLPPAKPTDTSQEEDNGPFQAFIQDCQGQGIVFETLRHNDSWQKAMDNVDPGQLTVLPFGRRFQLLDFKLEKYLSSASGPVVFCPNHYIDIESIALAYDGSENAKRALDFAVWLSDKATWPLTVLMVADSQDEGVRWMDEVEVYLETLPINSTTIILSGTVEKALCRFMQEGSVELLIMGACGNRTNRLESMGHTAAYLIEQADFPLMVVP